MRQGQYRPGSPGGRHRRADACGVMAAFAGDHAGSTTIIFSLSFALLMFATAMAIDYGRAEHERMRMQRALDAATLAAAHQLGQVDQETKARAVAEVFFRANSPAGSHSRIDSLLLDAQKGEVTMTAAGTSMTSLLNAFGINTLALGAGSKVSKGDGTIEVALVLDNSGSMGGQPIIDLRTASHDLVDRVFGGAEDNDKVRVSVVPFAGSVNIGASNRDSGWIDTTGLSPVHFENFAQQRTRFDLFSTMGVAWRGCVEARPSPHDTQDSIPTTADPATLFVPMFAPDEPDSGNDDGNSYPNSYLDDFGGSCPTPPQVCVRWSRRNPGECREWGPEPLAAATAQARTCKYDSATPSGAGPNSNCTTQPIQPLTRYKSDVTATIDLMQANGNTNIAEGVMWGWRALSPELPLTEGRSWDDANNQKFMVVMTDGQNTYQTYSNHNRSSYGAFAYAAKDRLGTSYSQSALVTQMNTKTSQACSAAKVQGITIYTIAFRLESDPTTLSLLRGCASGADKAYRASDGQALIQVFQAIGREIAQLRVSS
jgi:Flp pilus assembly protein TadG